MKIFLSLIITYLTLFSQEKISNIVTAEWLHKHLHDTNLVVVDVREADEYKRGHLKAAVNIPANENLFQGEKLLMPKLSHLKTLFSNAGINSDSTVVSYDGGLYYFSTRLYWLLKVVGLQKVAILDENYAGLKNDGFSISTLTPKIKKNNFTPEVDDSKIATTLKTLASIGKYTIIDGRKESDYLGITSAAKRYGHIPTALNFPSTINYTKSAKGTKIKDWKHLESIYKNIPKGKKVILYCDDSAEAAFDSLILEHFGYDTSVYEGSWLVWGNDAKLPVENPSKKR